MRLSTKDQDQIAKLYTEGGIPQVNPQAQELNRRLQQAQEGLAWEKQMGLMTEEEYQAQYQNLVTKYSNALKQAGSV